MKGQTWMLVVIAGIAALLVCAVAGVCQDPGPPPGGPPPGMGQAGGTGIMGGPMMGGMMGGPMMGMMGPPMTPSVTVVVADGVVYVACDGELFAFEATTLRKLGQATYWERPRPPMGGPGGPGGGMPQGPAAGAPGGNPQPGPGAGGPPPQY